MLRAVSISRTESNPIHLMHRRLCSGGLCLPQRRGHRGTESSLPLALLRLVILDRGFDGILGKHY